MSLTVEQIASDLNAPFEGNGSLEIIGIAGIREALEGDLSFVANARYATAAENTRATAVLVPKDWEKPCSAAIIRVESPDAAFAQVSTRFSPEVIEQKTGIHETAVISDEATVGEDVYIGPHCVLEPGCVVGDRTVIYAG
ncbi:MAG: LpxD N-terminal domain-containing protein, partial [Verrucomicrobiota bacterium]